MHYHFNVMNTTKYVPFGDIRSIETLYFSRFRGVGICGFKSWLVPLIQLELCIMPCSDSMKYKLSTFSLFLLVQKYSRAEGEWCDTKVSLPTFRFVPVALNHKNMKYFQVRIYQMTCSLQPTILIMIGDFGHSASKFYLYNNFFEHNVCILYMDMWFEPFIIYYL